MSESIELESLPPRPLRVSEASALSKSVDFRMFKTAMVSYGDQSPFESEEATEVIVVVADEWFAAVTYDGDGWEIEKESCEPDDDPMLLYEVALEKAGYSEYDQ